MLCRGEENAWYERRANLIWRLCLLFRCVTTRLEREQSTEELRKADSKLVISVMTGSSSGTVV